MRKSTARCSFRLLQRFGYDVIAVSSGAAAIATLRDKHVDLVLLDVQMPGVNGFDICAQLKAAPYTACIPVALVTGLNARRATRFAGLKAGADDFIGKTVRDPEEHRRRGSRRSYGSSSTPTTSISTEQILRSLASHHRSRDQYHRRPLRTVSRTNAVALGRRLGRSDEDLGRPLDRAGISHDIGKIGIPDALLLKPAALTPDEFELMKQSHRHRAIGCAASSARLRLVREIVRQHHERLDGSGLPRWPAREPVSVLAQIVSTVIIRRSDERASCIDPRYPPTMPSRSSADEAARGLRDPDMVEAFVDLAQSGDLTRATEPAGDTSPAAGRVGPMPTSSVPSTAAGRQPAQCGTAPRARRRHGFSLCTERPSLFAAAGSAFPLARGTSGSLASRSPSSPGFLSSSSSAFTTASTGHASHSCTASGRTSGFLFAIPMLFTAEALFDNARAERPAPTPGNSSGASRRTLPG
jgi:putative two-component system response regulator